MAKCWQEARAARVGQHQAQNGRQRRRAGRAAQHQREWGHAPSCWQTAGRSKDSSAAICARVADTVAELKEQNRQRAAPASASASASSASSTQSSQRSSSLSLESDCDIGGLVGWVRKKESTGETWR